MWIRSQDGKKLVKVTSVHIYVKSYGTFAIEGLNECFAGYVEDIFDVGEYETEERALEVLDEIQKSIVSLEIVRNTDYFNKLASISSGNDFTKDSEKVCIYQMPKE